jgi:hypothetical protein
MLGRLHILRMLVDLEVDSEDTVRSSSVNVVHDPQLRLRGVAERERQQPRKKTRTLPRLPELPIRQTGNSSDQPCPHRPIRPELQMVVGEVYDSFLGHAPQNRHKRGARIPSMTHAISEFRNGKKPFLASLDLLQELNKILWRNVVDIAYEVDS